MEAIVRAATELGVTRFRPALCERTIVRLEPARWRDRARRWQRVAREAAKQSGRAVVPEVEMPRPLAECLGTPRTWRCVCGKAAVSRSARRWRVPARPAPRWCSSGPRGTCHRRGRGREGGRGRPWFSRPANPPDRDGGTGDRGHPSVPARGPAMTEAGWEHFEVEADVGIRGWGPSRAVAVPAHPGRLLPDRSARQRRGRGSGARSVPRPRARRRSW